MQIGNKIKTLREMKNISQTFVAAKLKISQSSYSKIESGTVDLTFARFEEIASILGVELQQIIGFTKDHLFLNVSHNKKGIGVNINQLSTPEIVQVYQAYVESLKAEITTLTTVINTLLKQPKVKNTRK